jgi:hypothetical protein
VRQDRGVATDPHRDPMIVATSPRSSQLTNATWQHAQCADPGGQPIDQHLAKDSTDHRLCARTFPGLLIEVLPSE